ncbi:MAG: RNA-binding S4 domain-containing protein [Mariprofundus sp.]|nr:RNA-binding S4 domain-containing protein [Mariprofundus sp.]
MSVRIDKWLWAARFFKTRGLATEIVNGGHVQLNGEHTKASKAVHSGDELRIQRGQELFVVTVTALAEKRGSASIAQSLYQETDASIAIREEQRQLRKFNASPAPDKRPDKRARRRIIRFIKRED